MTQVRRQRLIQLDLDVAAQHLQLLEEKLAIESQALQDDPQLTVDPPGNPQSLPTVQGLLMQYHMDSAHNGREHMLHALRRRFWLLNGRNPAKTTWNDCQLCKNCSAKP